MFQQQSKDEANGAGSLLLGPGKGQIDARDMISIKSRIKISDARTKILLKRLQKGSLDARAKLQTKSMMAAKMGAIMTQQGPAQQQQHLLQPNKFSQQPLQYRPQQFQQPLQAQFQQSAASFQQPAPNFRQQKPQFQQPPHFQQPPRFQQALHFQLQNSGFHHSLPIQQPTMDLDSENTVDFTVSYISYKMVTGDQYVKNNDLLVLLLVLFLIVDIKPNIYIERECMCEQERDCQKF